MKEVPADPGTARDARVPRWQLSSSPAGETQGFSKNRKHACYPLFLAPEAPTTTTCADGKCCVQHGMQKVGQIGRQCLAKSHAKRPGR